VDEAVQLALENNRTLHSSMIKVESADARWSEVNANRLPTLKLQAGYTRLSEVDPFAVQVPFAPNPITISPIVLNNYSLRLTVQQPLFTGFRLLNSARAAERNAHAALQDYETDKANMTLAVKTAYWNLFKAVELERVVTENVAQVRSHRADVENFMNQGLAIRNDLLKVDVQVSNTELIHIDAKNAVMLATMNLNNLIGLPLETQTHLASQIDTNITDQPSAAKLADEALAARPELRALEARVSAADASLSAAHGSWYPQLYLTGNYYYSRPNQRIMPTKDEFRDTWDIGLGLSFDVWNWKTTAFQTTQAAAARTQTQDALQQAKDAVVLDVTRSYLEVAKAREKVGVAATGVAQAEENYSVTSSKFKTGLATNSDLLDAEVALLQAKTNHVNALVDHALAKAQLQKAVGR
jgi:outer membrane protein TolC